MPTIEILKSHNLKELRSAVSKTKLKGYSKLKKADLIDLMMENKNMFHSMEMKGTHSMPDGTVMTGSKHNKNSKPIEKKKVETTKRNKRKVTFKIANSSY